jgi:hypothetical protein
MTVGLTFKELLNVFGDSSIKRLKEAHVELMTSDMGFNPVTKHELERVQEEYGFSAIETVREGCVILAILDTIAKNNEAISKAISPEQ